MVGRPSSVSVLTMLELLLLLVVKVVFIVLRTCIGAFLVFVLCLLSLSAVVDCVFWFREHLCKFSWNVICETTNLVVLHFWSEVCVVMHLPDVNASIRSL